MATKAQQGGVKILWERATVNFADTAANDVTDSSGITVTGAVPGDPVFIGHNADLPAKGLFFPFVDAADTIKIRFINNDDASVDPASMEFTVGVIKLNDWQ
jgi:hypothetical protein